MKIAFIVLFAAISPLSAQQLQSVERGSARGGSACTYRTCGLGISPSLVGLDVTQGIGTTRVASLNFFLPHDVRSVFLGQDSALKYAVRAVHTRKVGAVLTDLGLLAIGFASARALSARNVNQDTGLIGAGGVFLLAVSYPIQLHADAQLSRAVWWHNTRYSR